LPPKPKEIIPERTAEEIRADEIAAFKQTTKNQVMLLTIGGAALLAVGAYAPASFMQHFIVFVLSVFVGLPSDLERQSFTAYTIDGYHKCDFINYHSWGYSADRLKQLSGDLCLQEFLYSFAGINIFGGFLVTRRMLAMFQKS
jgi:NAD(P) transhydrogenase subunit alpha